MNKKINLVDSNVQYESLLNENKDSHYLLKLYVSGNSPQSIRAILNIKKICEEKLKGKYILEVIDLYQKPEYAKEADLVAVPTLIKKLPLPLRRVIGDMSNSDKVILGLDLLKVNEENSE